MLTMPATTVTGVSEHHTTNRTILQEVITMKEMYSPDRYSYFVRLSNDDGDEWESEYCDNPDNAMEWQESMEDRAQDGAVTLDGVAYTHWELIRIDWYWHDDNTIDCNDFF